MLIFDKEITKAEMLIYVKHEWFMWIFATQ